MTSLAKTSCKAYFPISHALDKMSCVEILNEFKGAPYSK